MSAIDLDRIKSQGKNFVDGFTPGQKAMTILGVVAVVLAGMAFTKWSSATDFAPLYTNLSGADAGKVTQELDSAGVKWRLSDGGATVLVPSDMVYKERVALSAKGLPGTDEGLALLDKEGITASEFVQRVDYQRAMQGELEKTIAAIDGVDAVTVNLTIPPDQVFTGAEVEQPSAGVLIETSGGSELSGEAVQAIVHLVASSIPNMEPESVTVADSNGSVLNAPGMDASSGRGLEQQNAFDTRMSAAVNRFLATALGPNHADVHVQSDLNFDKQKSTSVTNKTPAGNNGQPIPEQQSTLDERYNAAANGGPNGIAGVTQGAPGLAGGTGPLTYQKTTNDTNNAIDKVQTEIQQAPGKINRLSVAVLLDSAAVQTSEVSNWTKQIQAAVGYDKARGDVVQVTTVPFSDASKKAAKDQLKSATGSGKSSPIDLARQVVTLLIVALVLFFAWRAIKKAEANRVPLRVPLDLRELEAADTRALEAAGTAPRLNEMDRRALQPAADAGMDGDLTNLIDQQPDEVAQTLRSWLADRRT